MPKYFDFKIYGYYLYFTSHCIVEAFHVYASDTKLTESSSAKFFVRSDGTTEIQKRGILTDKELFQIQSFIHDNYKEMYKKWAEYSHSSYYENK